jgi:hypothetical protein
MEMEVEWLLAHRELVDAGNAGNSGSGGGNRSEAVGARGAGVG